MRPEDVDPALVEKAARAMDATRGWKGHAKVSARAELEARHALAAVLPDIQARAVETARARVRESFDHAYDDTEDAIGSVDRADGYRHRDQQVRTVLDLEVSRLTDTTEEPKK